MAKDSELMIGCVADDFTGASDAASFLSDSGMQTLLISGIPGDDETLPDHTQAVVIALKTRTADQEKAVQDSMASCRWLQKQGAKVLYIKYCSTFDSTREGNIGPIADKVIESFHIPFTLVCPALPVNGRTVKGGELLVNGIPLHQTHMKDHPLTPMWDSRIKELLKPQSKYPAYDLSIEQIAEKPDEVRAWIRQLSLKHDHFYLIPEMYEDAHASLIVSLFADLPVWTGGSGLMAALTRKLLADRGIMERQSLQNQTIGDAILLAGSCSKATLKQIDDFQSKSGFSYKIEPADLSRPDFVTETIWPFIQSHLHHPVLVYSSDTIETVSAVQASLGTDVSGQIEEVFAQLAELAVQNGMTRVIVAGGETSGAVTQRLHFRSFFLGSSIAPGVPILIPVGNPDIRIVLKSGNFGQVDFFTQALAMTGE